MTKLSNTQRRLLANAAKRLDGNVLPLPGSLRGGAAKKVVGALLAKGLIAERTGQTYQTPDAALNTVWRNEDDGRAVRLYLTDAGLAALNIEPETPVDAPAEGATDAPKPKAARKPRASRKAAPDAPTRADAAKDRAKAPQTRAGTKQALLIEMLRRPEGTTIAQVIEATGWQPHTVRGAFAGALKRKLGLIVTSEKAAGGERVYRL